MWSISGSFFPPYKSALYITIADVKPTLQCTVHYSRVQTNTLTLIILRIFICQFWTLVHFETYFYWILLSLIIYENSKSISRSYSWLQGSCTEWQTFSETDFIYGKRTIEAPTSIGETEPKSNATPCRQPMNFLHLNIWIFKAHCIFDDYCI